MVGTPESIADQIEQWFHTGAADGFNLMPPILPDSLDNFVDHVIPELQRRGLFRTRYTAETLRGHLGLPAPPSGLRPSRTGQNGEPTNAHQRPRGRLTQ